MRIFSEQHRKRLSEANKKRWQDYKFKEKTKKNIKESYNKNNLRERRSEATRKQMTNLNQRIIRSSSHKGDYKSVIEKKLQGRPRYAPLQIKICKQCDKRFEYRSMDRSGIFCSHSCFVNFSKENANDYRIKAFSLLPNECFYCEEKDKSKLQVHHQDRDFLNNDIDNLQIICRKCHIKQHKEHRIKNGKFREGEILRGIRFILSGLRVDLKDQHFIGTPERILRSYYELFEGIDSEKEIKELFSESFPSDYDGIVRIEPVKCFSMCPHHLLPIEYNIHIGYISKKGHGKVLGLSKIPRVIKLLSKRIIIQEQLTQDIVKTFKKNLNTNGIMVIVYGKHMCMRMRGINSPNSTVVTSQVDGIFATDNSAKQEFLALLNSNSKF